MSLGTSNRDGGKTSESGHLRALGKVVNGDVIEGLVVSQRAAGANMSVDVAVGDAFVRRSDGSYAHPVFNDAVYNQIITTADGSNPRRDILVLYVDYGQAPSTAVSNNTNGVVKIKMVNGLAAGSPVDPSDSAIQSSVGAGNPWTKLARIRVPAGQTSITNTLIDDLRTMITAKASSVNTAAMQDGSATKPKIGAAAIDKSKIDFTDVEVYSTSEVDTGKKWIDGRAIYRKVFVGNMTVAVGVNNITHGISGISALEVVNINGAIRLSSTVRGNSVNLFWHREAAGNWMNVVAVNNTTITFTSSFGWGASAYTCIMEYVK